MEATFNSLNNEQRTAFKMIEKTNNSVFLAGRAGTGKTTFLRKVQEKINKKFVVLAPTGQAAINAGGQTIHSFFGLGFGVLGPGEIGTLNRNKIALVRSLDTIIIDEVSMVRCDIIDAIDRTLRHYIGSSAPFGGVQMVFVGDMFQLEPIATQQDRATLKEIYGHDSYYFYKAAVIERIDLPKIEFLTIYRQNDPHFIELLEHVRTGNMNYKDLLLINSRVTTESDNSMRITLTSTNADAKRINDERLSEIEGESKVYKAEYSGKSKVSSDVAEDSLIFKVGAQVMFTKNDRSQRWVNGTIGEVVSMSDDKVSVKLENGDVFEVQKEIWESVEYNYDPQKKCCDKTVVGRVSQLPLRLAWAITIHKSQSLTFDHVAIDFGRGAFSNGQAYVALSRARTLEGLELLRPMSTSSVKVSNDVLTFAKGFNDEDTISLELSIGEAVSGYEKAKDYDSASMTLFKMAQEDASYGHYTWAREFMSRAMAYTVDDSCLKITDWTLIPIQDNDFSVVNACGLFYSGKVHEAEDILNSIDTSWLDGSLLGLYILSRCQEERCSWDEVEETYFRMLALYNKVRDLGLDSISFRKMRYRLALLNESHYGDPGMGIIRSLMSENPTYDKYHVAMKRMFNKHPEIKKEYQESDMEKESSKLVSMVLDPECKEVDFLSYLQNARLQKDDEWDSYRKFINSLKLTMAC